MLLCILYSFIRTLLSSNLIEDPVSSPCYTFHWRFLIQRPWFPDSDGFYPSCLAYADLPTWACNAVDFEVLRWFDVNRIFAKNPIVFFITWKRKRRQGNAMFLTSRCRVNIARLHLRKMIELCEKLFSTILFHCKQTSETFLVIY